MAKYSDWPILSLNSANRKVRKKGSINPKLFYVNVIFPWLVLSLLQGLVVIFLRTPHKSRLIVLNGLMRCSIYWECLPRDSVSSRCLFTMWKCSQLQLLKNCIKTLWQFIEWLLVGYYIIIIKKLISRQFVSELNRQLFSTITIYTSDAIIR